jgi:prefoldin subunit 5
VSVKMGGGEGVAVESGSGVDIERSAEAAVKLLVAAVPPLDGSRVCRWGMWRR